MREGKRKKKGESRGEEERREGRRKNGQRREMYVGGKERGEERE